MSHISSVTLKIRDLTALKAAVKDLGLIWAEGQRTYNWYGVSVGDSPIPEGMTKEMLGKCEHAIKLAGVNYEIGVVRLPAGHYTLGFDSWNCGTGPNGVPCDGGRIAQKLGDKLQKLVQSYAVNAATLAARAKGWCVQKQTLPNGTVKLSMTGV